MNRIKANNDVVVVVDVDKQINTLAFGAFVYCKYLRIIIIVAVAIVVVLKWAKCDGRIVARKFCVAVDMLFRLVSFGWFIINIHLRMSVRNCSQNVFLAEVWRVDVQKANMKAIECVGVMVGRSVGFR